MQRTSVDHDAPEPVYQQLAAILRKRIESGELAPRRPIPSESTLMQEFGERARRRARLCGCWPTKDS